MLESASGTPYENYFQALAAISAQRRRGGHRRGGRSDDEEAPATQEETHRARADREHGRHRLPADHLLPGLQRGRQGQEPTSRSPCRSPSTSRRSRPRWSRGSPSTRTARSTSTATGSTAPRTSSGASAPCSPTPSPTTSATCSSSATPPCPRKTSNPSSRPSPRPAASSKPSGEKDRVSSHHLQTSDKSDIHSPTRS